MQTLYAALFVAAIAAIVSAWPLMFLRKQGPVKKAEQIDIDTDAATQHLCRAISCETTGVAGNSAGTFAAFEKLQAQLAEDFPDAFRVLQIHNVKPFNRLYCWKGSAGGKKPILLMAHQDVVPVSKGTEGDWEYPPFAGTVADGHVWGRGAIDMKNTLCAIFEAMDHLVRRGFVPDRDVYLCTTCDEEIMGAGSGLISQLCIDLGLHFEFVLDEGASFMKGDALGCRDTLLACLCTYEKGYCDVRLHACDEGGHSAYPRESNALVRMAKALKTVEDSKLPIDANDTFIRLYRIIAPYCDFRTKWMAAHPRMYARKLALRVAKSGPYGNAMVRTTTALTQIGASEAPNVLPQHVWANVNFRINPGFTYEALRVLVQEMVGKDIEVELPIKSNPSRPASIETPAYRAIGECIRQTFGEDIVVAPLAFFAGTDSRMFDIVSDNVYKFMPAMSHMEYASSMHGTNERIAVEDYANCIRFYIRLIEKTCGGSGEGA